METPFLLTKGWWKMLMFCAEIGSNHKGIASLAYEMIRQSALAGADLCKFQLGHWKPAQDGCPQYMRRWPTDHAQLLKDWCEVWGVEFFASIFSFEGLEVARKIGQKRYKYPSRAAFKSHSREDYDELLREMIKDAKEIYVSDQSIDYYTCRRLYCIPEYPVFPGIYNQPKQYTDLYGYSSHVHGYADALVAIARGARYIEKHVTLDKTETSIKDNHFALSFSEFSEMTKIGREMELYK